MKFAHIADCHLGGWREPKLQQLNLETFREAIRRCISEKVDFVIFAGDIFDSALPATEILENAIEQFRILKENNIKSFIIAGSHDFSASGKTFLNVIEKAGLCRNIGTTETDENKENRLKIFSEKFANDFQVVFAGYYGRKAGLEQEFLRKITPEKLDSAEKSFKILALHTTLTEAKPKGLEMMESIGISELPKGFDYYALGHLHLFFEKKDENRNYVYPGPLFPNNFEELEGLKQGSFVIVNVADDDNNAVSVEKQVLNLKKVLVLEIDADNLSPLELTDKILRNLRAREQEIKDKIMMLKISGTLKEGKTSELNFESINKEAERLGAFVFLKNTHSLSSSEFKELELENSNKTVEEIEQEIIKKYFADKKENLDFNPKLVFELVNAMNFEKQDGQTRPVFENKILSDASKLLNIDKIMN
ncbi:hypothetical protein COS75_00160 [Candidatus Pacearchaeota archaeon CG06_land_8_20_14_3_00_35_12]|nr:MAG: hypothetical protein COS75_00160 [Candidatus Pacearchaeota archaeon CG06_land_8_20_14_3_00_35_12]